MTASEIGAELVDVSSTDATVDLVLIPKSSINGSVILPEGVAPKGGLKVTVTASNNKTKGLLPLQYRKEKLGRVFCLCSVRNRISCRILSY